MAEVLWVADAIETTNGGDDDDVFSAAENIVLGIDGKEKFDVKAVNAEVKAIAEKYGFVDIKHALFYRTRLFTAKEYTELLGTYSDHIAIEEKLRKEFFSKIEEAIEQYGGLFTLYDTMDLQLARKP